MPKKKKRDLSTVLSTAILVLVALSFMACPSPTSPEGETPTPTATLTLTPSAVSGVVGYSETVTVVAKDVSGTAETWIAASDDESIATITTTDSTITVTLQAIGSTTVTVTSDSSVSKTVAITVVASSDSGLASLGLSSGTLSPSFDADTIGYTASVAYSVSSITVTPTANNGNATITVNSTTVASGSASSAISLAAGDNTITVLVTAEDGTTQTTYTITVTRESVAWVNLDHGVTAGLYANNDILVDGSGTAYSLYTDTSYGVHVVAVTESGGTEIGTGFGSGVSYNNNAHLALASDDEPIIMTMYSDGSNVYPMVSKYSGSGTSWTDYDPTSLKALFTDYGVTCSSSYSDLALDSSDNVYIAIKTLSSTTTKKDKAFVAKYDGSSWTRIGTLPDDTTTSNTVDSYLKLAVNTGGTVYLGMARDGSSENNIPVVYAYDGSGWSLAGDTISSRYCTGLDLTADGDGDLWVVSKEDPDGDSVYGFFLYSYSGSSWAQSGDEITYGGNYYFNLVPNGNQPLLAYLDTTVSSTYTLKFISYDGASWSEVAAAISDGSSLKDVHAAVAGGNLYVSYRLAYSPYTLYLKSYPLP